MVDYAALAGLVAFAWLPLPGFTLLGPGWPKWVQRIHRMPFWPLQVVWNFLHFYDVWLLMETQDPQDVQAVVLSWVCLKLWGANFFHPNPILATHLLTSCLLFVAAYFETSIASPRRVGPAICGLVLGLLATINFYLGFKFLQQPADNTRNRREDATKRHRKVRPRF